MIEVRCDMCGGKIDYELNGINVDFNHYGTVTFRGSKNKDCSYQLCNVCASELADYIEQKGKGANKAKGEGGK